ncbi:MAG: ArsR family transcriptional regulator [Candidatus Bathyarchaeota archaeon]|nr:ArsR family transcriptional regulator [Candidatus Termiticorpusculum sp.]
MSSDFEPLRKVLKDETNRQMLLLLNDRGALTSEELTDALNVTAGLLGYHLRELNDLVEVVDDKYVLSEKGKQAYQMLDKLSENTRLSRRWKISWCLTTVSLFVIAFSSWYVFDFQFVVLVRGLVVALLFSAIMYYLEVKPMTTARLLYIGCGASALGVALWLLLWGFANMISLQSTLYQLTGSTIGFDLFFVISLVVCCVIGGLVGEWHGKRRQYRWPPFSLF